MLGSLWHLGLTFFISLSVQLKAECNKGYVKVKQVCVFVIWVSILYLMISYAVDFRVFVPAN